MKLFRAGGVGVALRTNVRPSGWRGLPLPIVVDADEFKNLGGPNHRLWATGGHDFRYTSGKWREAEGREVVKGFRGIQGGRHWRAYRLV